MNKQIKHFAEQSNIKLRVSDIDPCFWSYDENSLTKFAELIVKECISVARRQRNPANLNYKPSERFVEELQQYFGVE